MKVFLKIVSFSLQTEGSGQPVLTKGKRLSVALQRVVSFEVKSKLAKTIWTTDEP